MPYPIDDKLVIAIASSALFDLAESDQVYREQGVDAYRSYQRLHENDPLEPGPAFPLIRRLLALNGHVESDQPVEVILLSRNDPDTGLRVFNSIEHHGLNISRGAFVSGSSPFRYINTFNASLFLSANPGDVKRAIMRGAPAGRVFPTDFIDKELEEELRIAFDFDGVVADDSAERVHQAAGLNQFQALEAASGSTPLPAGPLNRFFKEIAKLQRRENQLRLSDPSYKPRVRIAIVTARNAPAHKRVVASLREWGIEVDETFFLGGIDKTRVLKEFRPHIFFDDQLAHLEGARQDVPCAHIPFGIANDPSRDVIAEAFEEHARRSQKVDKSKS